MKKSFSVLLSIIFIIVTLTSCNLTVTEIENSTTSPNVESSPNEESTALIETESSTEASIPDEKETGSTTLSEAVTEKVTETTTEATTVDNSKEKITCTIEISCKTILSNINDLDPAKANFVPDDGIILKKTIVTIDKGSTVFDVLRKVCSENKIHLEYRFTPAYNSYYIEGINQLYEFDCGDTSGWMYSVNGVFPNKGCNMYVVNNDDEIKFLYTCSLGQDLGADF